MHTNYTIALVAVVSASVAGFTSDADAGLTRSTITSISCNSTLTGYPGSWGLSLNNAAVTDSRTADSRLWSGNTQPAGYGGSFLILYTKQTYRSDIYNGGFVDWITLQHDTGSSSNVSSWSATGSLTFVFDNAVTFHWDTPFNPIWTYNGSTVAQGTRFEAGTYSINYSTSGSFAPSTSRMWQLTAYVAPAPIPAPGAIALLGLAGLAGRRRR
ncbi:MAG: hypothetical protein RL591_898 [Planctomycetota bacterium]